jgi:DnaJ-class molecular chaperone
MNLYQELELPANCSQEDIKRQYRTLAHQHHPDRGGDAERFKRISVAYEVLSDVARRAEYDRTGQFAQDNNIRGEALGRLGNMINHYVPGLNADVEDLIVKMQMDINQESQRLENEIANARRQIHNATAAHKKLWVKNSGENILKVFVENFIERRETDLINLARSQTVLTTMKEILADYHYGDNEWLAALAPPN